MRNFFRRIKWAKPVDSGIKLRRGPATPDGVNRIYPEHRIRVSDIDRITDRNGMMTTGWSRTHATRRTHNGWGVDVRLGIDSPPVHVEMMLFTRKKTGRISSANAPYLVQINQIAWRQVYMSWRPRMTDLRVSVIPWLINPGCSLRMILSKQHGSPVTS